MDDNELLNQFYQNNDDQALACFVEKHRQWATARARRIYPEEAEDVVQMSILKLMDCEPKGNIANPLGWWSTLIATTALDLLRKRIRRRKLEDLSQSSPVTVSSEDEAHRAQLLHLVHEEIDNLEDAFRSTLLKRFFDGMSYREISVALNCSTGTVSSRLSRAIDQIRSNLDSRGIGFADTSGDINE